MNEYLMVMHEIQKARMADGAERAGADPGERYGGIRQNDRFAKIKARFGLKARNQSGSQGATK